MGKIWIGNIKGEKGDKGDSFKILGYFTTANELYGVANPSPGDAYGVGSEPPYSIYIYSADGKWVDNGTIQGAKGEKGEQGIQGVQGEKGDKGDTVTITEVTATVDETTGTPTVTVTMSGTETEKSFSFAFSGLKGEKGEQGIQGEKGEQGIQGDNATIDINTQTPTYTENTDLVNLTSGEKINVAFGKIKKAITDLIAHLNAINPHGISASTVGLGNVNNTSDADKPVSTAQATAIADAKGAGTTAQNNLTSHIGNTTLHITSTERATWNGKAPQSHASTATTYGVGTSSNYGHLKITDSTSTKSSDTAASATAVKAVADSLSALQTMVASNTSSLKIVSGSYAGTGTYISGQETPANIAAAQNTIQFPSFPKCILIKRQPEKFWHIISPNPDDNSLSFRTYGGNDYSGGLCSGSISSDYKMTWYANVTKWYYSADLTTGQVSIKTESMASGDYATLKPIYQLNWEGSTYDYIAFCV